MLACKRCQQTLPKASFTWRGERRAERFEQANEASRRAGSRRAKRAQGGLCGMRLPAWLEGRGAGSELAGREARRADCELARQQARRGARSKRSWRRAVRGDDLASIRRCAAPRTDACRSHCTDRPVLAHVAGSNTISIGVHRSINL